LCIRQRTKAAYQTQVKRKARGESQPTNIALSSVVVHKTFQNIAISHEQQANSFYSKLEFPFFHVFEVFPLKEIKIVKNKILAQKILD